MVSSRREFLANAVSLTATAALGRGLPSAQSIPTFTWVTLRDDAWMVAGAGGNVTVIREGDGAIVIDTKSRGFGSLLRADVEARVGHVRALIVTHHHGDHVGGASAFTGVQSVAHRNLLPRAVEGHRRTVKRMRGDSAQSVPAYLESLRKDFEIPVSAEIERAVDAYFRDLGSGTIAPWEPTRVVDGHDTIGIGGTTLQLHHVGNAHTDNDLVVVDSRRKLLIAGDLLFHRHHPFVDVGAGATTVGWQTSLAEAAQLCDASTVVVSGHGTPTDRGGLDAQSRYFDEIRALVRKARSAGQSIDDVRTTSPPAAFAEFGFADGWVENLAVVFKELDSAG